MIDHLMNTELSRAPDEHKILITEPPNNPPKNREELCTLMFEEFQVPKFYLGNQAVLSLFATGRTTGTVLDAGEGITHTVPIYEGYAIPHAITEIPLSGYDLTHYAYELITKHHRDSELTFELCRESCRAFKEG
jgi:actin-related protein